MVFSVFCVYLSHCYLKNLIVSYSKIHCKKIKSANSSNLNFCMLPLANPQKNDEGLATLRRARPPQVFLQGRVDSMSDFKKLLAFGKRIEQRLQLAY